MGLAHVAHRLAGDQLGAPLPPLSLSFPSGTDWWEFPGIGRQAREIWSLTFEEQSEDDQGPRTKDKDPRTYQLYQVSR
jgi:hypothetical protein